MTQAPNSSAPCRSLVWAHGQAELQRLGGMLGPVVFRHEGCADFAPLQVAPWADEPGSEALPGILRRLRGEWPCVPFGRTDRPAKLPLHWLARDPGDAWGHGFASHHDWQWLDDDDPLALTLQIEPGTSQAVKRLTRRVRADASAAALAITLQIEVREPCTLPVALHPTLRLDAGRVELNIAHTGAVLSYPAPAEPGISRLAPDREFSDLRHAPLADGGLIDLSRYPLPFDTEELLQLQDISAPVRVEYLDSRWSLELDWDRRLLPDLMLWVSHRGRRQAPWNGRHWALGLEPVNGPFDLGRVATPPPGHPAATRVGLKLHPDAPLLLRYGLRATPLRDAAESHA